MKNSYGIYKSESELVEAKIHSVQDIIDYLKDSPTAIRKYTKARASFQKIFNTASASVAGINIHELEELVAIYAANKEANQSGALLPLLDYYKAADSNNSLWAPTSTPEVIYFRWVFTSLAFDKSYTNASSDFVDSFIRTVADSASSADNNFGIITQSLASFLKNAATNPNGCIREYLQGKFDSASALNRGKSNIWGLSLNNSSEEADFFTWFRSNFEIKELPTVDGVSYSNGILQMLVNSVLQKEWACIVSRFEEISSADDILALIYAVCIQFFDYAESHPDKCTIPGRWDQPLDAISQCITDGVGKNNRSVVERMSWEVFDYVNKYRRISEDPNTEEIIRKVFVRAIIDAYDDFISNDIGIEYSNLNGIGDVPWEEVESAVSAIEASNAALDTICGESPTPNEPNVRTIINGIGRISITPATEASRKDKEGEGSIGRTERVQKGEKARRGVAAVTNAVNNGVYAPYKKFKNAAGAIDNQLAKITKGLKDAILNTNSAKYREEVIGGKKYSPLKILAKVIGGYAVFCTSKVLFIVGLVTRYYCGKRCKATERRKAIVELENETKILDEKIADAQAAGDNKAKYELMRVRNSINSTRDSIITSVNRNPDKQLNTAKKALLNVEVNTNGNK